MVDREGTALAPESTGIGPSAVELYSEHSHACLEKRMWH